MTGPGFLNVTVRSPNNVLLANVLVTVVRPDVGPVAWEMTGPDGVASFSGLAAGDVCVHARDDIALDAANGQPLFPLPNPSPNLGVTRRGNAAVITVGNTSAPLTVGNYRSCLDRPPVKINTNNNATTRSLTLRPAATVDVSLLGLNGAPLTGNMHVGIITPFGACEDFPWLPGIGKPCSNDDLILPGFLNSVNTPSSPAKVSVPPGLNYVIEALQNVPDQGLLTFTRRRTWDDFLPTESLQLEPVLCEVEFQSEALGDGKTIDIGRGLHRGEDPNLIGKVKHGIQATYPDLAPDKSAVAVWWEQSGSGSMSFSTRTNVPGLPTLSTTVDFVVTADGRCNAWSFSKSPGANTMVGSVFCAPQGQDAQGRLITRITVRHHSLSPDWDSHEFNIRGGGDAVPDASKSNASRAYVPVTGDKDTCSPDLTNDDRWAIFL